jgi:hypothetical protein
MASNSCKGHFALALVSLEDVGPTFRLLRPVAQAGLRNNSCACAGPAGPSQPASQPLVHKSRAPGVRLHGRGCCQRNPAVASPSVLPQAVAIGR